MKKRRDLFRVSAVLLAVFIVFSVLTFWQCSRMIQQGYLEAEGTSAKNFAVLTAANIHLTDADVERLKGYSYAELLASPDNQALKQMMSNDSFAHKVDYAYIMVHLKKDEVRYTVTEENSDSFDAPLGTPLDIMWLLDVNVADDAVELGKSEDQTRFSYYIDEDALIFGEAPTYIYHASEWGNHICGYAPLYSEEGRYIGVVGVELKTGDYEHFQSLAVWALGGLLGVSVLLLTLLFVNLYVMSRRIQMDRIYTDPLTHLRNRSFYNDHFIQRMNGVKHKKAYFALMIADIDLFKRVNDTFGHDVGDEVLQEFGDLFLREFDRESVFRFGGEEFVVGLWVEDEAAIRAKLDQLFDRVRGQHFSHMELTVGLSLGCAYTEQTALNGWLISGMLRAADGKLYEAKESGRGRYLLVHYQPEEAAASAEPSKP